MGLGKASLSYLASVPKREEKKRRTPLFTILTREIKLLLANNVTPSSPFVSLLVASLGSAGKGGGGTRNWSALEEEEKGEEIAQAPRFPPFFPKQAARHHLHQATKYAQHPDELLTVAIGDVYRGKR